MQTIPAWIVPTALGLGLILGAVISVFIVWVGVASRRRKERDAPTLAASTEALLSTMPMPSAAYGPALRQIYHNDAFDRQSDVTRKVTGQEWFQRALMSALVDGEKTVRPPDFHQPEEVHVLPLPGPLVVALINDERERFATEAMRREFIANASHELNTPVAAIGLLSEAIVRSAPPGERVAEFAESLQVEAERLAALTKDIGRLSEAQVQASQPPNERINVVEMVQEVVDQHQPLAKAADVELAFSNSKAASNCVVQGGRKALMVALGNLVENAIEHSPAGSRIGIGVRAGGGSVKIQVSDKGAGIALIDQPKIFHRFWRADASRSRKVGGTGLGLSIARNTAQGIGGDLTVWSKIGVGSTFSMTLPISDTSSTAEGSEVL